MEQIFAYLRERLNGQRKVELNRCIALLSQYYIEGGAGIDTFLRLKRKIDKYVELNRNRPDISNISILERWASSFSDNEKCSFISDYFNIGRNNMVDIPRKGRANVVVVDRENNRLVHIEKLYDTIKASRNGINRKTHPYIWQWSISASEYDDICNALYICKSLYREEVNDLINNEKCVFIIVAFIAEQYKREWFGNNGNKENALEQLGLGDKVEIIAETYFGDRSKDIIFKHPSSGRLEYLDSLRVEGGLPIKYIVEGDNQLSNFADKLFRDYEQAIKFLLEQLDNKCIRHSYEANYSIYQYLEAIKSEEGPYNIYGPDSENIEIFRLTCKVPGLLSVNFADPVHKEREVCYTFYLCPEGLELGVERFC